MFKPLLAAAFTTALAANALAQTMAPGTMSAPSSSMAPVMKNNIDKHETKALPANSMAPHGPTTPAVGADPMKGNLN